MEKTNKNLPNKLNVTCEVVPENPFYVRWLNRFGGIDYWMFSRSQLVARTLGDQSDFEPYIADYERASGTNYAVSKEAISSVTAGSGGITQAEWYELSRIAFSPRVQWYNEQLEAWIDILPVKSEAQMDNADTLHNIEIEFMMPKIQLQL